MERKYVTNLTRDYSITTNGEVNQGKSLTVPDRSIPLSDLLRRSTLGEVVPSHHTAFQDDDDDQVYHAIQHMDLADIDEYRRYLSARVKQIKSVMEMDKRSPELNPIEGSADPSPQEPEPDKARQATDE